MSAMILLAVADPKEREQIDDALTDLRQAYAALAALIRDIPSPRRAYAVATELAEFAATIDAEAKVLRAEQVVRIRDAERLSLAKLADLIGVSKGRAQQIVQIAGPPDPVDNGTDAQEDIPPWRT